MGYLFLLFADYESRGFILSICGWVFCSAVINGSYPTFADPVQITQSRTISTLKKNSWFLKHAYNFHALDSAHILLYLEKIACQLDFWLRSYGLISRNGFFTVGILNLSGRC
jgi:hypothetical protein